MTPLIQPTPHSPNIFALDSLSGKGATYLVNLEGKGSCTCPHYQHRLAGKGGECKHLLEARRQLRFARAVEKARKLSDEQLEALLQRYQEAGAQQIAGAIRVVRHERRLAARQDAQLRETCA